MPEKSSPVYDASESESGSDFDDSVASRKKATTKAKASIQARGPKGNSSNTSGGSSTAITAAEAEKNARKAARIIQKDENSVFQLWKPHMGHGDPYKWHEAQILYDPRIIDKCKTEVEFWKHAPKYAYYSDRGIQAIVASKVTNDNRRLFIATDLDANGDPLAGRKSRGQPGVDSQGNIVKFVKIPLHGDLGFDVTRFIYNTPEIFKSNGTAADKGPDPVWNPKSPRSLPRIIQ